MIKDFFNYLQAHGLYESDALEDRVVFLFVFVPILRSEIKAFVETWNEHRIRPQKHRPNHVAGIPNELYTDETVPRYGWAPDIEFLSQLTEAVRDVGKQPHKEHTLLLTYRIDPDAYLSDDTLTWCEETLRSLGHTGNPSANEFLPQVRHFLVPAWFRQLRIKARTHIESGEAPQLSIAPKPDTFAQWRIRQEIIAEMRNEVDTFRLIETGDLACDDDHSGTSDEDWDY